MKIMRTCWSTSQIKKIIILIRNKNRIVQISPKFQMEVKKLQIDASIKEDGAEEMVEAR